MREYETVVITKPDVADSYIGTLTKKLEKAITSKPGEILKKEDWGLKKLAYEIKAQKKGRYLYWFYAQNPEIVAELDKQLRFDENVIRYATLKTGDHEDAKKKAAKPVAPKKVKKVAAEA